MQAIRNLIALLEDVLEKAEEKQLVLVSLTKRRRRKVNWPKFKRGFKMTSEQANLQDKQTESLQAIYRKVSIDFVSNKQKIDRDDLMIMRYLVGIATIFLFVVLSGWTGFYN